MSTTREPTIVVTGLGFAEGLRWHAGELWFSDFRTRNVTSVTPSGKVTKRAFIPGGPSGLGWSRDGELLVTSMIDQQLVGVDAQGRRRSVASLVGIAAGPLQDMLVHTNGTAYIGDHGGDLIYRELTAETVEDVLKPAPLFMVTPDLQVRPASGPLRLSNGMAEHSDGRLIVTETLAGRILIFDVDGDGSLSNQRVFADLGRPSDGITIDSEDAVWTCVPLENRILRVKEGGAILDEIVLPQGHPVDCAIGDPDGMTLYVAVTYTPSIGAAAWGDGEVDSAVESWRVDVPRPSA